MGGFTVLVILFAGELMARSRAGLGLTMIALLGAFVLGFSNRSTAGALVNKLLVGVIALVAVFSLQFALYRFLDRIPDSLAGDRPVIASTTIEAAKAYMPLGSGVGTFVPVYAMFEKPEHAADTYVNRAHNDMLEMWLESGMLGLALGGIFVIWLVRRSIEIWRSVPAPGLGQPDWYLIRATTIVPLLLLAHSLVDFPLRTGAIMAIMAFACALLIEPPGDTESAERVKRQAVSERTRRDTHDLKPAPSSTRRAPKRKTQLKTSDTPLPHQRWGADMEWPKEWSKEPEALNSLSSSGTANSRERHEPPAAPETKTKTD
jgi:O-antigen ligase